MAYSEQLAVRTRDCDLNGRWRPSAILEAMQEVAITHCDEIGLGRSVTDARGVVWVLSRQHVAFTRLPRIGERYSLETCAMPLKHLFFPRAHVFRHAEGGIIGTACGLWLLMDVKTRTAVREPYIVEHMPVEDPGCDVGMPGMARPLNDAPTLGQIVPRFTEFDLNGHVNNARYMDWCWNALGFDGLARRELAAFDVNYDREVRRDEVIETSLWAEGDRVTFHGLAGGLRCFSIGITLRETDYVYRP